MFAARHKTSKKCQDNTHVSGTASHCHNSEAEDEIRHGDLRRRGVFKPSSPRKILTPSFSSLLRMPKSFCFGSMFLRESQVSQLKIVHGIRDAACVLRKTTHNAPSRNIIVIPGLISVSKLSKVSREQCMFARQQPNLTLELQNLGRPNSCCCLPARGT